jgi:hypothetical protein
MNQTGGVVSLYTIVFILVTILVSIGLVLFGLLITKLDRWIDRKERLGRESIYKEKDPKVSSEKTVKKE